MGCAAARRRGHLRLAVASGSRRSSCLVSTTGRAVDRGAHLCGDVARGVDHRGEALVPGGRCLAPVHVLRDPRARAGVWLLNTQMVW